MSSQRKTPRSVLPSCHHKFANDKPIDTRYTLDFDGRVDNPSRYWWPVTEAIGAMAALIKLDRRYEDEVWYHRLWVFANRHLIDHQRGGWYPQLGAGNRLAETQFLGKPDIYHLVQAPLFLLSGGLSRLNEGLLGSGTDRSILAT